MKSEFTRNWRKRNPGRAARVARRWLKESRARHERRTCRQALAVGAEAPAYAKLNAWEVI